MPYYYDDGKQAFTLVESAVDGGKVTTGDGLSPILWSVVADSLHGSGSLTCSKICFYLVQKIETDVRNHISNVHMKFDDRQM